jgi:hypothetical protein
LVKRWAATCEHSRDREERGHRGGKGARERPRGKTLNKAGVNK